MRRKGNNEGRVSCEYNCRLCPAKLPFGRPTVVLPAHDVLLWQCWKKLKTIKKTCEVCQLSAVWFLYLPAPLFAMYVLFLSILREGVWRSTNIQVELSNDRMWLEAKLWELPHTVLSDYLCVSHIHKHTHTLWQRSYCHSDTLSTLSERMVLLLKGWKSEEWRVQEGRREKEGKQNHVRHTQGRFGIV